MKKLWFWRLRRAYRRIAEIEAKLAATGDDDAYETAFATRVRFSGQTVKMLDGVLREQRGVKRARRRQFKRMLAGLGASR